MSCQRSKAIIVRIFLLVGMGNNSHVNASFNQFSRSGAPLTLESNSRYVQNCDTLVHR